MKVILETAAFFLVIACSIACGKEQAPGQDGPKREPLFNLPTVEINTDGGAPILDKKNYVSGTVVITDTLAEWSDVPVLQARMGIRGRGNSTWSFPKKPWKVKLDTKSELLGMPADKEWCLLANYADRTLMRNLVALRISEICGFSWTPRARSVEVWLNGDYQGVYTLCEHKKISSSRINIELVDENATSGTAIEGDYYIEIEEAMDGDVCWYSSMGVPLMFSDPETPNGAQQAYIKAQIQGFEDALRGSGSYSDWIDVDSFINNYIIQELTKNIDGNVRKSSFLTKEKGGKLEMYHVWDFDLALGGAGYFDDRVGSGPTGFWIREFDSASNRYAGWYWHLFQDAAFTEAVKDRWNELYPRLQEVEDYIDRQEEYLSRAAGRNFLVWNINESVDWVNMPSKGSYEAEVLYLREFYHERLEWLNTEINRL